MGGGAEGVCGFENYVAMSFTSGRYASKGADHLCLFLGRRCMLAGHACAGCLAVPSCTVVLLRRAWTETETGLQGTCSGAGG